MDTSIPWTFQRKGGKWFRSVTTGVNSTYLKALSAPPWKVLVFIITYVYILLRLQIPRINPMNHLQFNVARVATHRPLQGLPTNRSLEPLACASQSSKPRQTWRYTSNWDATVSVFNG